MRINVQLASSWSDAPHEDNFRRWAEHVLVHHSADREMTVRLVDLAEGTQLNERWRAGRGATNVLAFPLDDPRSHTQTLGDVVICAPIVKSEAAAQAKSTVAHLAHMVVHGTLHLLGYDHQSTEDAEQMESLERTLLAELGYSDPYL